ncbi:MAG: HEAT repeat domain-containing protein, partial [Acidobacteria bacterium]|nr:HEAT repeat domain-containing protein [Acidobacteriota bacterium]
RLVEAREAQTAGRTGDVLRLTDDIVRLAPANRDAAALRIDALVANREIRRAAAEYDRYRVAAGAHDAQLLATVARAELWVLSGTGAGLQLRSLALERLARGGDAAALQALRASAKDSRATAAERLTANLSLARLGERDAVDRLVTIGESPDIPDRTPVVEALEAAGARSAQAWILQRLRETNPLTRAAAARALGTLKAFESIARLREMLSDSVFLVRFSAAISLKRLGDSSADPLLADWLQSDLPDVRLMAAEAYTESMTREWVTALKPVLQTPNELQRVKAAALLRRQDERASRSIVFDAVRSPNPAVRNEASRYLEALTPYDLGLLRSLLDDDSEWVRLHAAGALIKN